MTSALLRYGRTLQRTGAHSCFPISQPQLCSERPRAARPAQQSCGQRTFSSHICSSHSPLPPESGKSDQKEQQARLYDASLTRWQTPLPFSTFGSGTAIAFLFAIALSFWPHAAPAATTAQPLTDLAIAGIDLSAILETIKQLVAQYSDSPLGILIFAVSYTAFAVLLVPASLLTLTAGYLYGTLRGTALVSLSATLGACLSFLGSRYVARRFVADRLKSSKRFQAIDAGVASSGARLVLLLRLSPIVPYGLTNYMLGLTNIEFWKYALSSWAGMLPGTLAYVSLGNAGKAGVEAGVGGDFESTKFLLYGLGAVASLSAVSLLSRIANDALDVPEESA